MSALVTIVGGQAVTTSIAIADGTENQHKNVLELIRTYRCDLEEFGGVTFETQPFETQGGTQQREVAHLNEQQQTQLPKADHQHAGRFTVKAGEANGHAFHQTRFTPDGIAWVAKRYSKAA